MFRGGMLSAVAALTALLLTGCATTAPGTPSAGASKSPQPTSSTPTGPRTMTVSMTGDQLWHMSMMKSVAADAVATGAKTKYNYQPLFQYVRPLLVEADVAICHAEVPMVRPGQTVTGYPSFGADPSTLAGGITDNGFDMCTTASNHSLDRGFDALVNTLDQMEKAGIVAAGTSRTEEESRRPRILTTKDGVKIGLVAGTYGSNGGTSIIQAKPWSVDWAKADAMLARAKAAREAGADIVIVNMHAGNEYQTAPNALQKQIAEKLSASPDVDLIYGHHAHTVQPITKVNDTWVAYGVGNFFGQMRLNTPRAMEAIIAEATFTQQADGSWKVTSMGYVPLLITWHTPQNGPARIYPVNQALASGVGPTEKLKVARQHIRIAVGSTPGLAER